MKPKKIRIRPARLCDLKNPNKTITFHDLIRGDISFDTAELGDFVVAKDKETPLYHLAVVVDDHEMGITHVIRGEDHISTHPAKSLYKKRSGQNALSMRIFRLFWHPTGASSQNAMARFL